MNDGICQKCRCSATIDGECVRCAMDELKAYRAARPDTAPAAPVDAVIEFLAAYKTWVTSPDHIGGELFDAMLKTHERYEEGGGLVPPADAPSADRQAVTCPECRGYSEDIETPCPQCNNRREVASVNDVIDDDRLAVAEFVAAFDAFKEGYSTYDLDPALRAMLKAREALDVGSGGERIDIIKRLWEMNPYVDPGTLDGPYCFFCGMDKGHEHVDVCVWAVACREWRGKEDGDE